ncbi:MAG TPA: alpha/beta hydrolase [Fimbriimonadaceae bacterium]|nr:alpha/beta hydrolase [Fimbriimonadaceae bacterium]HRJ33755.1 alpha/beta hydrolase [Fimbriimonadaceae bacterium]
MTAALLVCSLALWPTPSPGAQGSSLLRTQANIIYEKRYEQDLRLDIIRLRSPALQPQPAIVFVHGGAWRDGRKDQPNPTLEALAARGFICVAIEYRLSPVARFPAQIYDVKAALRWIRREATTYDINPNQIGIWGISAGAHLAALAATSHGAAELTERGATGDDSVQAVAFLFGTVDFASTLDWRDRYATRADLKGARAPETQLLGVDPRSEPRLNRLANPAAFVRPGSPPFLVLHGTHDEVVPPEQSQILVDALRKNRVPVRHVLVEDLRHELKHELWKDEVVDFFLENLGPAH